MRSGILYGVGVGPGDPELMTVKAVRLLSDCDVIAVPQKKDRCFALSIAVTALPELEDKPVLELQMPMTRDQAARERAHDEAASVLAEHLDAGQTIVFLTLGDPSVYSTFGYIHRRMTALGYESRMIPGVPSFCAAASSLGISLCEDREELHLLPGGKDAERTLGYPGCKVFMKGELPSLLDAAEKADQPLIGAENCGTQSEMLYHSSNEIPENAGYYTLIIAKERKA